MADFSFVTSNNHKVRTAEAVCRKSGISFERENMDLVEIQSDSGEEIAKHKVEKAFEVYQSPVAVTDDSWLIPGLRGFPGPYMKHMNHWLTPGDFLNLTRPLPDRRIIMRHIIAYKDAKNQKVFSVDIEGVLLKEARGSSIIPHFAIISFNGGKQSVAEAEAAGAIAVADSHNAWNLLCDWLKSR